MAQGKVNYAGPSDTGAAFVVIPHLPRTGTTYLPELLKSWSTMPAELASNGRVLHPNRIYIIPPAAKSDSKTVFSYARAPRCAVIRTSFRSSSRLSLTGGNRRAWRVLLSGLDANGVTAVRTSRGTAALWLYKTRRQPNTKICPAQQSPQGEWIMCYPRSDRPGTSAPHLSFTTVSGASPSIWCSVRDALTAGRPLDRIG